MASTVLCGLFFNGSQKKLVFNEPSVNLDNIFKLHEEVRKIFSFSCDELYELHLYDAILADYFEICDSDFPITSTAKIKVVKPLTEPSAIGSDSGISSIPPPLPSSTIVENAVVEVSSTLRSTIWAPNSFKIPLEQFSLKCRTELGDAENYYKAQKAANPDLEPGHNSTSFQLDKEIRTLIANYLFNFTSYPTDRMVHDACNTLVSTFNCLAIRSSKDPSGTSAWVLTICGKLREMRRHSDRPEVLANKGMLNSIENNKSLRN